VNRLYFGDNLKWLSDRKEFPDASVALVYLDPPFNSNADYNVLFREPSGQVSQAQFHAFTDTWSWAEAADAGRYTSKLWHDKDYPRIQILTVEGLLNGTERIDAPPQINPFAMAARESAREKQAEML
jgi:adenine specific DNA methylase Mod